MKLKKILSWFIVLCMAVAILPATVFADETYTVQSGETLKLENCTFNVASLVNNGAVEVYGETSLNIGALSGNSIDLMEGAVIKDSNVGGQGYVAGNVLFRGDNTFAMLTDYGNYYSAETPSMWTVEKGGSLTMTNSDRYGLGYGDKVAVYGELAEGAALTVRDSLTTADADLTLYGGLVGMTNSAAPNAQNSFTAEDAYLRFGFEGDKSFGNKAGNYYGNYTFSFENVVMDANAFKFYEDLGTSTVSFKDSDLYVGGVFMTNDASSQYSFENTKIASYAKSNGSDDKNQNAGTVKLKTSDLTYSAKFTNVGTVYMDSASKLIAPVIDTSTGTVSVDASGLAEGIETVVIEQTEESAASLEGKITITNDDNVTVNYDGGDVKLLKNTPVYVAKIGETGYSSIDKALGAAQAGDTVTICAGNYQGNLSVTKAITVEGETDTYGNNLVNISGKLSITADSAKVKNININNGSNSAGYIAAKDVIVEGCSVVGGNGFRSCYTSGTVTFRDSIITGSVYGVHFDGSTGGNIVIDNCKITGWSSFASTITKVTISDTEFAEGNYNQLRFYQSAEISDSIFNPDMTIDFGTENVSLDITNCTVSDSSAITDIIYLGDIADMGVNVTVDNTPVVVKAKVTDAEGNGSYYVTLQEALNAAVATKGGNVTVEILDNIDLTGTTWTPVYFNSYSADNANTIVIEGNEKTITGLSDMMFSGVWTGDKLEIRNLTLDKANIVNDADDSQNKGVGAFVGNVSAVKELVITNCHLINSHVEGGHWTGGFVGYAAGYSGNDGPVFTEIAVENCSVTGSTIMGKGSVGGIVGHATGDAWTTFSVEETAITGNTITSTGSSTNKAGIVMGTIGAAGTAQTTNGTTLTGGVNVAVTESGNVAKSNETTITTVYGRQGSDTGVLTITGGTYANNPIEENVSYAAPAEGYEIVKNEDNTYGVVLAEPEILENSLHVTYTELGKFDFGDGKGEVSSIRLSLFAGVDTLNYSEAGFDVTVNGTTETFPVKVVYGSVKTMMNGKEETIPASKFGKGVNYIFGQTINFPATDAFANTAVKWTPYAIRNKEKITGNTFTLSDIFPGTLEVAE